MAPMKTGGGGYREASCASVSLYDGEGERLSTVRMARMPESKKVTLKTMVGAEVEAVLGQRPDLQLVKIADGANDNWTFLSRVLPEGVELIDFFHAAQHLSDAFDAAYGANAPKAVAQLREVSPSAALRRRRCRAGDSGIAPSAFQASRVRTYRASPEATSATIDTAWVMPRRRTRDCLSAPGWWRRRARPWSLSGSSVRACGGVSAAGRPFAEAPRAHPRVTRSGQGDFHHPAPPLMCRGYAPHIRTTTRGRGSGKRSNNRLNRSHVRRVRWLRRRSHLTPDPLRGVNHSGQTSMVAVHSEVIECPAKRLFACWTSTGRCRWRRHHRRPFD